MRLLPPTVRVLLGKELRQVRRSRGAMLSATVLPTFIMLVVPLAQLLGVRNARDQLQLPASGLLPPGMAGAATDPTDFFVQAMLPLFVALGALMVPSVAATYTVIAEREKRSLELLMALPVRVSDILAAKLVAMLALALAVVTPLYAADAVALALFGLASPGYLALLLMVLLAALFCSVGVALLLALLARDFRTANNLSGALVGPLILGMAGVLFGIAGPVRLFILAGLLLAGGGLAFLVGLRWLTFERYLA